METKHQELYYKVANSEYELQRSYQLRYKVYCKEKKWMPAEDYPSGMEIDKYDSKAIHVIAMDEDFNAIGNMRILRAESYDKLPYQSHPGLFKSSKNPKNVAELSRLIVSAKGNQINITRGLLRAVYQVSRDMGIDNWIFVVEPSLVRLLGRFGFYLNAVGTPSMYFGGFTMASICNIAICEKQWEKNRMDMWQYYNTESIITHAKTSVA